MTPRRTRLVRVHDLHSFRRVIAALCQPDGEGDGPRAVVVPTRAAARTLAGALTASGLSDLPPLLTRDQLYDVLHQQLSDRPRRLTVFERDAMAQASATEAASEGAALPFQIRPGLVAEMLRFYDHLRRQSQQVSRFEALITDTLGGSAGDDRGVERLLQQTQFLAGTFRAYERRRRDSGALDEHALRDLLVAQPSSHPLRHLVVTTADWIADPTGLFVADFDLLARIPHLERLDLVCTEAVLGSGFHERLHNWWPGLDEIREEDLLQTTIDVRPRLACPVPGDASPLWFTFRDREEELLAVAQRLASAGDGGTHAWNRAAVVFKRPLPYLYLAPDTLGAAGLPYQIFDELPLAAEPAASTLDLVFDAVDTGFARGALLALLGSPHLRFNDNAGPVFTESLGSMNHLLSDRRYLGGLDRLEDLAASPDAGSAAQALGVALAAARELERLTGPSPASRQLDELSGFLTRHWSPLEGGPREDGVRASVMRILRDMAAAHGAHHDPVWKVDDLAWAVRRWIGDETFPVGNVGIVERVDPVDKVDKVDRVDRVDNVERAAAGVHLLDDQAARYGEFDDVTIVGLIENEWPDRPRRNIFYPPELLKALGWPSEKDRRAAADARFLDLLASSSERVALSTFILEDEALVTRSLQLEEVPRAKLSILPTGTAAIGTADLVPADDDSEVGDPTDWDVLRRDRSPADAPEFHGAIGPRAPRPWSVSALETYIGCPFKFFAQHVLKLDEEPDDEEVMDPRRQGQFVHEVFETFFAEWQREGHKAVTAANLDLARARFTGVVDRALKRLPEGEAALERTRLLGSSAAAGLGEAVFRMEAERPVAVVERLLEHSLSGTFSIATDAGPREIELRGKADRVDLLADGTFRLIDYKLGWPPDRNRALQLPIYGVCAEQRLLGYRGQPWRLSEAVYLAFKGPKRVVPLFPSDAARDGMLASAQQRLVDVVDAIGRGEFPPSPDDVYRCETCSFSAVCRKDYVGDI